MHYTLFIPPPWVWLDLLSTFVLTPFFIFTEEDPDFVPDSDDLCLWIWVTRRSHRMAQDSDDFLFIFNIIACVCIVILAIVALLYLLPHRVVR